MNDAITLLKSPEGSVVDVVITLEHSTVHDPIEVTGVTFAEDVNFDGADLRGNVLFVRCNFKKLVAFRGVAAPDRISFVDCEFFSTFSLAAGTSKAGQDAVENSTLRHVKITGCTFHGYTTFNNRRFTRTPNFSDSTFLRPPHFQNVEMHQGLKLDGMSTPLPKKKDQGTLDDAVRAFRRLAQIALELGLLDRYNEFKALELRTRLRSPRTSLTERIVIAGYWAVSDFGRSISRPFVFFSASSCLFVAALLLMSGNLEGRTWQDALSLIMNGAFQPFSTVEPSFDVGNSLVQGRPWADTAARTIGILESFAAVSALSLFLFALRRRFLSA